jgi:hypothetical protein
MHQVEVSITPLLVTAFFLGCSMAFFQIVLLIAPIGRGADQINAQKN